MRKDRFAKLTAGCAALQPVDSASMSSLRQYFDSDFAGAVGPEGPMDLKVNDLPLVPPVMWKLLFHHDGRSRFGAFFVPAHVAALQLAAHVIKNFGWFAEGPLKLQIGLVNQFQETLDYSDCIFTRRIILYVDADLTIADVAYLSTLGSENDLSIVVRDAAYARRRDERRAPLAFISHDWRDKESMARPLAVMLTQNLCTVWYDEFSLRVGDSLRGKIEEGLRTCRRCVLLLTPHFLANDRWAKREFESIFTRELVEKQNLILPVWAGVTREDVFAYSPILADRVGASWDVGVENVAKDLLKVLL